MRKVKGSKFWHIYYYWNGRQIRESSKSELRLIAEQLLRRRLDELGLGFQPSSDFKKLKYENIRQSLLDEYSNSGYSSLIKNRDGTETVSGLNHLDSFFAGWPVAKITTDALRTFIRKRKQRIANVQMPAKNSSVNRNLALLHRMMNLAMREGKIQFIPRFPILEEKPPRKGFLSPNKFEKLRGKLPRRFRPLLAFLYSTGRSLGDAKNIDWSQINLDAHEIHLESGRGNERSSIIPLDRHDKLVAELKRTRNASGPVFCVKDLRKAWQDECLQLGCGRMESLPGGREVYRGLLIRDLRRSALLNMIEEGVSEKVAMAISGHKSRKVFDRFNIVSTKQLHGAMQKVGEKTGYTAKKE